MRLRKRLESHSVWLRSVITLAILVVFVFVFAGGVYDLLEQPPLLAYGMPFWPALHEQTLGESIAIACSYVIGIAGLFIAVKSATIAHKPRQAITLLFVGVMMLVAAFVVCQYLITVKIGL